MTYKEITKFDNIEKEWHNTKKKKKSYTLIFFFMYKLIHHSIWYIILECGIKLYNIISPPNNMSLKKNLLNKFVNMKYIITHCTIYKDTG